MSARGGTVSAQGTNREVTSGGNRNVEWVGSAQHGGEPKAEG